MSMIDSLNWRYATKKFDPNKQVSDQDIETLKEAIRLSHLPMDFSYIKSLLLPIKQKKN